MTSKIKLFTFLILLIFLVGCNRTKTESNPDSSTAYSEKEPVSDENTTTEPVTSEPVTSEPATSESASSESASSEPATTEPATTEPVTEAIMLDINGFGTLYSKSELEAMDNSYLKYDYNSYGDTTNRPAYAINAQKTYGVLDTYFIMPDDNKIYLTFDLGYEYNNNSTKILDILKEKNVKAVFFPTLDFAKMNPETIQRIIDEGHILGNHSANHIPLPTTTVDTMRDEIIIMHNYIAENYNYTMSVFRPPQGLCSERSLALTQSLGYKTLVWSFAYKDYDTKNQPDYDYALTTATNSAHSGALYLLHAVSDTNVAILPELIDSLHSQGYTIELFQ